MRWPLVVAAALVGCAAPAAEPAPSCDLAYVVQDGFSPAQRATIERSLARWSAMTGKALCVSADGERSFRLVPVGSVEHRGFVADVRQDVWAVNDGARDIVVVAHPDLDAAFEHVIMHEIGHGLGLGHLKRGERGIMANDGSVETNASDSDLAECRRVKACYSSS